MNLLHRCNNRINSRTIFHPSSLSLMKNNNHKLLNKNNLNLNNQNNNKFIKKNKLIILNIQVNSKILNKYKKHFYLESILPIKIEVYHLKRIYHSHLIMRKIIL